VSFHWGQVLYPSWNRIEDPLMTSASTDLLGFYFQFTGFRETRWLYGGAENDEFWPCDQDC